MSSPAPVSGQELSALVCARDRLAYLWAKRQRLVDGTLWGLVMAWVVVSAGAVPTPLSKWSWLLALCVLGLSLLHVRLGAIVMGLVCTVQMLSLHGQLGVVTAFLCIVFLVVCEGHGGRWFAVLVAPYLMPLGLAIAAPLGLALAASRKTAWFWVLVAFLWCVCHGLATGHTRLGVAPLPQFTAAMAALAKKPVTFDARWFRTALSQADVGALRDVMLDMATQTAKSAPLIAQMLLWCAIASLMRALYVHRRVKDRVAIEYLEKITRHAARRVPPHRQLFGALATGALAFVVTYIILAAVSKSVQYTALQAALDVLAAALLWGPLWVIVEGDVHAGQESRSERRAQRLVEHGATFRDLPVGEGGTHHTAAGHGHVRVPPPTPTTTAAHQAGPAGAPHHVPTAGAAHQAATAGATHQAAGTGAHHQAAPHAHFGPAPAALPSRSAPSAPTAAPGSAAAPVWTPPTRPASRAAPPRTGHGKADSFAVEAIVFIDMVGSTAMGSKYGDEYVLRLKERLGDIVGDESQRHGALFSKGTGDGFMLTFPEAENAVFAAENILRQVRQVNAGLPESRAIHLRIGVHMGQVNIDSHGDRIGTAANFAARIEGAKLEQLQAAEDPANVQLPEKDRLLVSDVVREELKDNPLFHMRPVGYFEFKGISGLHRISEVKVS